MPPCVLFDLQTSWEVDVYSSDVETKGTKCVGGEIGYLGICLSQGNPFVITPQESTDSSHNRNHLWSA